MNIGRCLNFPAVVFSTGLMPTKTDFLDHHSTDHVKNCEVPTTCRM